MANPSIAGWVLLGLGAAISLLNWVYVYLSWRTGRSHSLIPLVGGVCLMIGALLVTRLRPFAWVAVFADSGTIVVFLAVPAIIWEAWRTCPLNLLGEFVAVFGKTTIRLRLFRRGVFTIRQKVKRPPRMSRPGNRQSALSGFRRSKNRVATKTKQTARAA
jgi:hypothetical protein